MKHILRDESAEPSKPDQVDTGPGVESLDAIGRDGAALDGDGDQARPGQAGAAPGAGPAPEVQDPAGELLTILVMAREMALPILPPDKAAKLRQVWTDPTLKQVASAGAGVLTLHGIRIGSLLPSSWAPYGALVMALAQPVLATRAILAPPVVDEAAGRSDGGAS